MFGLKICKCSVEHNCILNKVSTEKCIWIQLKQLQVYCVWWGREVEEDTQWSHLGLELPPPPTQRHTGFVFCIHFRDCISICFVYCYLFLCIKSNAHTYIFVLFSTMKLCLNIIVLVLSSSHHHPFVLSWTVKQLAQNISLLDVYWVLWCPPHQKLEIRNWNKFHELSGGPARILGLGPPKRGEEELLSLYCICVFLCLWICEFVCVCVAGCTRRQRDVCCQRVKEPREAGDTFSEPIISHFLFSRDSIRAHIQLGESQDVPRKLAEGKNTNCQCNVSNSRGDNIENN